MDDSYVSAFHHLQEISRDDVNICRCCDTAPFNVPPHHHDFYELYCLLSDSFVYHVEDKPYELKPGSLLLIWPGEDHWPDPEGPSREIERIVLWLNPQFIASLSVFLPETLGVFNENRQAEHLIVPEEKKYQSILELLCSLLYEKDLAGTDSPALSHLILSQLLIHISREFSQRARLTAKPGTRHDEIMKIHEYINGHFQEPLSVNGLAQRFFMDKNTMTRHFKQMVGMTPGDYIRRKRLENAHALIRQGYSAQHAGYTCGYTDYSAFYRAFCRRYGFPPGELTARTKMFHRKNTRQESGE